MVQDTTQEQQQLDEPQWGVKSIAAIIHRTERQTHWLLQKKLIDASKVGNQWVSTRRRLRASLGVR
jgi:hypothetical protein